MPGTTWKTRDAVDVSPSTTTLTAAYAAGWVSDWYRCRGFSTLLALMTIAEDDATTIELITEVDDTDDTDGFQEWAVDAGGSASLNEVQLTAADVPAAGRVAIPIDVTAAGRVRVRAKKTGGTGSPTLTLELLGA